MWLVYLVLLAAPILVLLPRIPSTTPTTRGLPSGRAADERPAAVRGYGGTRGRRDRRLRRVDHRSSAYPWEWSVPPHMGSHRSTNASAPAIASPTAPTVASPGRVLTDDQAQAVAESVQTTLPGNWKPRPATTSSDDSPVEPAECEPLATDAYITALQPHRRAAGSANFNTVSTLSSVVSSVLFVKVFAYKGTPSLFSAAADALAACPRLTTAIAGGGDLTIDFEGRPAPALAIGPGASSST